MIFPNRSATSRHRSFSIKPVGPTVPVACPQWPASITILPIFKPSARVSVDCPSRVGSGALAARIRSGLASVPLALTDFGLAFFAPGKELRVTAEELLPALEPSIAPPLLPLIVLLMAFFEFAAGGSKEAASSAIPFVAAL